MCFVKANVCFVKANVCFVKANVCFVKANVCFVKVNVCFVKANVCFVKANVCFVKANMCFAFVSVGRGCGLWVAVVLRAVNHGCKPCSNLGNVKNATKSVKKRQDTWLFFFCLCS